MNHAQVAGIILAGGQSRRYGVPKMFAMIKNRHFYEVAYENLRPFCDEIVIVAQQRFIHKFPSSYNVITDEAPFIGHGPLAGILAGMNAIQAENYIILPCDMPLMEASVIEKLLTYHEKNVTLVQENGQLQPLVSIWHHQMKQKIYRYLKSGNKKIKQFLTEIDPTIVDACLVTESPHIFMNVNTRKDDEELRRWIN